MVAPLWKLLWAVSLVTAAAKPKSGRVPKTELTHSCSRSLSRIVRQRFRTHILQHREGGQKVKVPSSWPDACPFSPLVDIFGWHELNKSRSSKDGGQIPQWVCNYTGKTFKNEHYIDLHMENYYMEVAPKDGVCLADYCELFGFCNVKPPNFFESLKGEPPPCDPKAVEAQKVTCAGVADRCALPDDPLMPHLREYLHKSLCEPLSCEARAEKHFSGRKESIVFGIIGALMVLCIVLYCACVPAPEGAQRQRGGRDRRPRNAGGPNDGVPRMGREQRPPTDMPTKNLKQE